MKETAGDTYFLNRNESHTLSRVKKRKRQSEKFKIRAAYFPHEQKYECTTH